MAIILTGENFRLENEQLKRELDVLKNEVESLKKQLATHASVEDTHLVVNGQARQIGKKSQYLLDMLTLPEDK